MRFDQFIGGEWVTSNEISVNKRKQVWLCSICPLPVWIIMFRLAVAKGQAKGLANGEAMPVYFILL